jgi:hypothetical protein
LLLPLLCFNAGSLQLPEFETLLGSGGVVDTSSGSANALQQFTLGAAEGI